MTLKMKVLSPFVERQTLQDGRVVTCILLGKKKGTLCEHEYEYRLGNELISKYHFLKLLNEI